MAILSIPNASQGSSWNNSASMSQNVSDSYSNSWGSSSSNSNSATEGMAATQINKDFMNAANALAQSNTAVEMAYNAAEAQKNRDWQEMMSNTAYQRAIKDMKAAGLNPILAAGNGGATTPSGGMAASSAAQTFMANAIADQWSKSNSNSSWGSESRSHSEGWSEGRGSGGSQNASSIAEQVEIGMGALADAWGNISDTNTGKKVQEIVNKGTDKIKEEFGNYTQGLDKVKDWMKNSGIFTTKTSIKDKLRKTGIFTGILGKK